MRSRRPSFRLVAAVVVIATTAAACTNDASSPATTPQVSSPTTSTVAESPSSPAETTDGPTPTRTNNVTLAPPDDGSFLIKGSYPPVESSCRRTRQPVLRARYPGRLTVQRTDDGSLTIVVTLPFERYLEGIAEVPPSWPPAALEAQAIAARTYALATTGWTGEERTLGSPICSTASCQVYRGIPVPAEPRIVRWYQAVRRSRGQMLVYQGRPAQTLYFSTSNGRTHGNDEVFGSDPLPYLRPVPERDDGASPTSRWRVELPTDDLTTILGAAGLWPDAAVHRIHVGGGSVRLHGGGRSTTIDLGELRDTLNTWAPCVLPGRYPPDSRYGTPLPLTVPSGWFGATASRSGLVLQGRGWGHGVGMVQWGAYGKARRGLSAAQILAFYYGGLRPQPFPEPRVIDVEVASGLTSVQVIPDGAGATIDGTPVGRRGLEIEGDGRLRVNER